MTCGLTCTYKHPRPLTEPLSPVPVLVLLPAPALLCGESAGKEYRLLFESRDAALSKSDGKERLVEVPTGNRADHMEYVGGLVKFESLKALVSLS